MIMTIRRKLKNKPTMQVSEARAVSGGGAVLLDADKTVSATIEKPKATKKKKKTTSKTAKSRKQTKKTKNDRKNSKRKKTIA